MRAEREWKSEGVSWSVSGAEVGELRREETGGVKEKVERGSI